MMKPGWALDGRSAALIAVVLCGLVGSQILLKAGLTRSGGVSFEAGRGGATLLRVAREPILWAGIACTVAAALVWMEVISRLGLAVAYPFLGLSYVLMMLAQRFLFHEPVSWARALGTLLIAAGVALVARQS